MIFGIYMLVGRYWDLVCLFQVQNMRDFEETQKALTGGISGYAFRTERIR